MAKKTRAARTIGMLVVALIAISGCGADGASPRAPTEGTSSGRDGCAGLSRSEGEPLPVPEGFIGTVVLLREGRVAATHAGGCSDRSDGIPTAVGTAYDIGSIAKSVTALSVLLLEEDGLLDRGDRVAQRLPGVPADKQAVTIQQLLEHSGGLPEYVVPLGDFVELTRQEAVTKALGQPLRFPPGTSTAYSNAGYTVLAAVVENVSGRPFREFVADRVIGPTGARIGFFGDDLWPRERVAVGYGPMRHGTNSPLDYPMSWGLLGAGGMVAAAEDLARFFAAVDQGDVVRPSTLAALRSEAGGDGPEGFPEGFLAVAGASSYGFSAAVAGLASTRTYVAVLSNTLEHGATPPAEELLQELVPIAFGFSPPSEG